MRLLLWLTAAALLLTAGCKKTTTDGAIRVSVHVTTRSKVDCVAVVAAPTAGGPEKTTELVPRGALNDFTFGVISGDGLSGETRVQARGFVGPCNATALLNVESEQAIRTLTPGVVVTDVTLTLDLAAFDDDQDGYRRTDAGGPDCFDEDAGTNPGRAEVCGDGVDNNCDQLTDCQDQPTCNGAACDDGMACTVMDRCALGTCTGAALTCLQPPSECFQPMGQCDGDGGCVYAPGTAGRACDGGVCRNDGVCVPANTEFDCTNGQDDDGDGLKDCADPDCFTGAVACDDLLGCTRPDRCQTDGGGCAGAPVECQSPTSQCGADAGSCVEPSGTCVYPLAPGKACVDADSCTDTDTCLADGGCAGRATVCPASTDPCYLPTGTCQADAGGCVYQVNLNHGCDDLDPCTQTDRCQASGQCAGEAYSCNSPPNPLCYPVGGSCQGDGGCTYVPNTGLSCQTTGVCLSDGTCQLPDAGPADAGPADAGVDAGPAPDAGAFPQPPSNFDPLAITARAGQIVVNCATATVDTTAGTFHPCSGANLPLQQTTQTSGGGNITLFAVSGLVIADGGLLTVTGNRPLIIASFGDVEVHAGGRLLANSARGAPTGPGANIGCLPAQSGATGTFNNNQAGGGGGAGLGDGGSAGSAANGGQSGGAGGKADSNPALTPLNPGCKGGNGLGSSTAPGGNGGGALQISSTTRIQVGGVLSSSGAGGTGAVGQGNAGGGGGSGGSILLEALRLDILASAAITANGGGGGEGSARNQGGSGGDGTTDSTTPATRGRGGSVGGDGATGGTSTTAPGTASNGGSLFGFNGGGGGGGGGIGRLRLNAWGGAGSCALAGGAVYSAAVSKPPPCP